MERLTEKQSAGYDLIEMQGKYCEEHCRHQDQRTCRNCAIYKAIQKLAHYEDLEEQGLLIKLPCEPNEYVWCANAFGTYKVVYPSKASIIEDMELGYGIGYTKEEAEAKLKELQSK